MSKDLVVNDVTGLNPIEVAEIVAPRTVEEVQDAIRLSHGPISIGGGRFSMGGQTAVPGSLHLDMRGLNQVVNFSERDRFIRVQSGTRWFDVQSYLDPHGLAVMIMQTYSDFTVGGSLSVNSHGRYVGLGPLIYSVRSVSVVLADGRCVEASSSENSEVFNAVIGGYGGLGVIVEAELTVVENIRVERTAEKLPVSAYRHHFADLMNGVQTPIFHNADVFPPGYARLRSVSWLNTSKPPTQPNRLQPEKRSFPLERYFFWAVSETPFGKLRREFIIEPLVYLRRKVHWRNYEAGYRVAELEPASREKSTYVLQEYFIPVAQFEPFLSAIAEILRRYRVNVINISIRHAYADPGSFLAWAREEVFAYVLYYKQRVTEAAKNVVAIWTRELIEAALRFGGTYYLPYQVHARPDQFHRAYPRAKEFFQVKRKFDPAGRFRNVLWEAYEMEVSQSDTQLDAPESEFVQIYSDTRARDRFFLFLQNIYRIYPEGQFHSLITDAVARHSNDAEIYRDIQDGLPDIKPFLSDIRYGLPALKKQKREMASQALEILADRKSVDGYVEIGSTGRYIGELRRHIEFHGNIWLVNDLPPTNAPADILERGRIRKIGTYIPLNDYRPLPTDDIADASADLVTCFIGLHHAPLEALEDFIGSIRRVLRPGGVFILRDHDVTSKQMDAFVSLAHTVFNAGLGVVWQENEREFRRFRSIDEWCSILARLGFAELGPRLRQEHDPTDNILMGFEKRDVAPD